MNEIAIKILRLAISVGEVWLCYQTAYITLLEYNHLNIKRKVFIWVNIFILGILLAGNRSVIFFSKTMLWFCIIVTSACIWIVKRKQIFLIFVTTLLYYTLAAVLDMFFAFISMDFLKENFIYDVYIYALSFMSVNIFICSRLIIWSLIQLLKGKDIYSKISVFKWEMFITGILLQIVLIRYQIKMVGMVAGVWEKRGVSNGFSLLVLTILFFIAIIFYLKYKLIKKENEILIMRELMMAEKYKEVIKNNQLIHDMKNHFIVLKNYKKEEKIEKIYNYVDEISEELLDTNMKVWTGQDMIDLILNQKKDKAEREGIKFQIIVVSFSGIRLTDSEIISVFGNLLDNAIEACMKIKNGHKWIDIKLESQNEMLYIEVKNSIDEVPLQKNGIYVTMKNSKIRHGWGLINVRKIVERYSGIFSCQTQNGSFVASITFYDNINTV